VRLFVAVNLPDAEIARLAAVLATFSASDLPFRWVAAESIHITLKFLGEVPDARVTEIGAALRRAAAGVAPFDVAIGGFGAFGARSRPRVLWVGVAAPPALHELQERVEAQIEPLGYPREQRDFSPHLTIGRLKKDAGKVDIAGLDRIMASAVYKARITVESADLMRSHLSPRGARYERIGRAVLEA
jgi:2'-5' RNA ligase